jgi:DNA helicase-2/ATP-dependent DNA helicase PcrA
MPEQSDLLSHLNQAQKEAVTHGEGPLLIVAGAGTGKTTVLTHRYVWLLREKNLKPENVLALTFTEKAAGEMEDRILQMLPNGTYDFWISTFHGFCQRILEEKGLEIGIPNRFRVLNETDGWLMLKRRIDELPLDHYRPLGNPVKFLSALQKHISRAKDENVSPEEYLAFATEAVLDGDSEFITSERKRLRELADLAFAYRKIMRDEGSLDFGDLIQETLRLLRERPGVLKELRERFPYILVDEFQDTNWAQYELIKLLAGEPTPGPSLVRDGSLNRELNPPPDKGEVGGGSGKANLTVVGDDDQAIYKFRGASLANILQFRDDYPDAKTIYLTDNYRSKQEILDLAYGFIKQNDPNRLEVKLSDSGLSKELKARREVGGPAVGPAVATAGPVGVASAIDVRWYRTIEDEAQGVAHRISELKQGDPSLTWNDIAILVRSNDGAEPFVRALDALAIPFRFYALRGLYAKPVILDVINFLRIVDDQQDSTALWRVLNMPTYDVAAGDLVHVAFHANKLKGVGLWQACSDVAAIPTVSEAGKKKMRTIVNHIENLADSARREPPLKLLQFAIEKTGLLNHVLNQKEADKLEQIDWLNGLANRVKRYEANTAGASLKGFLEELQLEIESGEQGALKADPDQGPELVKILTVHASKGLEFRHVFLVSLVDQRFPTRKRSDAIPLPDGLVKERLPEGDTHLEEERRLFYVALTRAKDSLTLTGADDYGGARQKKPSPFLAESGIEVGEAHRQEDSNLINLKPAEKVEVPATDIREIFPLKRRFSYTQLAAFRNCPLQYKFAHLYRIPILGSYQKSFGQSVHLALHDILKLDFDRRAMQQGDLFSQGQRGQEPMAMDRGFRVAKEEAERIYKDRWIDEWYPDRAKHNEYLSEGMKAVRAFVDFCAEHVPNVKRLEAPFDWRIGPHSIKGAIDRIDGLEDGSIAIFDYKTGEAKEAEHLYPEDKEQLRMYQLAMEEKGERVSRLALVYVRGMVVTDVEPLEAEKKAEFREKLIGRMNDILTSDYKASPSPFVCTYCDFRDICEFRKL